MTYRTARSVAQQVREGQGATFGGRALLEALEELLGSSLCGRGIPSFDADLTALSTEVKTRIQKGTLS